ncbi:alpha/beta fold hydrolase [Nocardia sp. NPDC052566]|uniref:alpha/beta fold hydrolase n=1 Tax=Nocardia sp. NPDC052566 TaxID=3364330 RepID=UPI0037CB15A6
MNTSASQPHLLSVTATDETLLSVTRLGSPKAPATLAYLHGPGADASYWTPLTSYLDRHLDGGIVQITYDQRGHGHSGGSNVDTPLEVAQLADDLDAVLTRATGHVVLVTHSLASMIVHAYAERYPQRARTLAAVVMFAAAAHLPESPALDQIWPHRRAARFGRRRDTRDPLLAALYEAPRQRRFAAPLLPERQVSALTRSQHLGAYSRYSLTRNASTILRSVPTLVISGELDTVITPGHSRFLAELIWADTETLTGAGHSLPYNDPARASGPVLRGLEIAYQHASGALEALAEVDIADAEREVG